MMIGLAMAVGLALPQHGTAPAEPCGTPAAVPAELHGWSTMVPVVAGRDPGAAPLVPIGRGTRVALSATGRLRFARAPGKAGIAGPSGGMIAIVIGTAGRYRVALGESAWIDVIAGTTAIGSVAHRHGPACSPVRKMVDFDLAPGRYLIQIAGSRSAGLPLMIARVAR